MPDETAKKGRQLVRHARVDLESRLAAPATATTTRRLHVIAALASAFMVGWSAVVLTAVGDRASRQATCRPGHERVITASCHRYG